jgi:N-acetyl-anhydromuramyl-L-alanine amidase AmpD
MVYQACLVLLHLLAGVPAGSCMAADSLRVIDRLMDESHSAPRPPGTSVDVVVIHFASNVVADRVDPFGIAEVIALFRRYSVSSHYLIGRDGQVYRLVEENRQAFHEGPAPSRSTALETIA